VRIDALGGIHNESNAGIGPGLVEQLDKFQLHPGQVLGFVHDDVVVVFLHPLPGLLQGHDGHIFKIQVAVFPEPWLLLPL